MHVTGAECFPRPTITLSSPPGNSPLTYSKLAMANRAKCVTTAGDSKKKTGLISDGGSRRGITWRGATGQSLFPATATCEESLATRPDSGGSRRALESERTRFSWTMHTVCTVFACPGVPHVLRKFRVSFEARGCCTSHSGIGPPHSRGADQPHGQKTSSSPVWAQASSWKRKDQSSPFLPFLGLFSSFAHSPM